MTKKSIADDVVARAQTRLAQAQESVAAYLAPTGTPTSTRTLDRQVARMTPQDLMQLAAQDPKAAETAARRMEVIDARAAATADTYSDITD